MADTEIYTMTVDYNVLTHLGLNLYSSIPAVLAEAVANAWDADAQHVSITIDMARPSITIEDDGSGMSRDDLNQRYLCVGYQRRDQPSGSISTRLHRPVMGRKGIGKLSLFSVAKTISIRTVKDGETNGLVLEFDDIRRSISEKSGPYHPHSLSADESGISKGTQIVITNLTKRLSSSQVKFLRKRLAQRFSVIDPEHDFEVSVDGKPITVQDRDYLQKLQYGWFYGDAYAKVKDLCPNLEGHFDEDGDCGTDGWHVSGWIGTVKEAGDLKNEAGSLNRIVIMARGKLAQEDMLSGFAEGGIYTKYLIGEISADFLDADGLEDIAASSRQAIMEEDPRFEALQEFLQKELKKIQSRWTTLRNAKGLVRAAQVPAIASWLKELNQDEHAQASALLGKINQLPMSSEKDRNILMQHAVLAFENLRYKHNLIALDRVTPENLLTLTDVFISLDDIEATLYAQIVRERIQVIEALETKVEDNAKEKVIQSYLFEHLWLLDPSWERATGTEYMEKQVAKAFGDLGIVYGPDEKLGRLDIHYATTSGKHLIIELKRSERPSTTDELSEQVGKYVVAMQRALNATGRENEAIEVICVLGRDPSDWRNPGGRHRSDMILSASGARIVFYKQLIDNAYASYKSFLTQHQTASRLARLIESIDVGDDPTPPMS